MILTCPDCSTRYSVKDGAVGPNGRTVRCSNCQTTWFVTADADSISLEENIRDERPEIVAEPNVVSMETALANEVPPSKPVMGAHVFMRDKADRERRNRRLMGISLVWIVTAGILLSFIVFGLFLRQPVVDRWPATAAIYKAVGISVKLSGLDFEDPTTRNVLVDGRPVLVVNGLIINGSDQARDVPLIRLSLHDNAGEELVHWMVEPPQSSLEARQRMEYVAQYPNPPLDAVTLKFRFNDDLASAISDD